MRLKFIQLNIFKGKYLNNLIDFLLAQNPDFISMQEVTSRGFNFYEDKTVDLFNILSTKLKMRGVFQRDLRLKGDKSSVFGNAIFSKYPIIEKNVILLKSFRPVTIEELDSNQSTVRELIDRHLLDAQVEAVGGPIHILSWHGAWTAPPHDTDETFRQASIAYKYIKNINEPFILGGDLNSTIDSRTIKLISSAATNFMDSVPRGTMTTNKKVHKIAPRGYLIDYIFASPDVKLKKLAVAQITVSDHLPLIAEVEI